MVTTLWGYRPKHTWSLVEREAYERAMEDLHAEVECGEIAAVDVCERLGTLIASWERKLEDPHWLAAEAAADGGDMLRKAGA